MNILIEKVILIGNVGIDPDVRYLPNGSAVTTLSLATSETWKDKTTGEKQEKRIGATAKRGGEIGQIVQLHHVTDINDD